MIVEANIKDTGESTYSVIIEVSGHTIMGDEPLSFGGGNLGPAPYDLFVAALGECTAMAVRFLAKKELWQLERIEVHISYYKKDISEIKGSNGRVGVVPVIEKRVVLHGDKLTDEQRKKLMNAANNCPLQRTIESNPVFLNYEN
jgi:putative redox protein